MAGYNIDKIVEDFQKNGNGKYSSYHASEIKRARAEGRDYPALQTFRSKLESEGILASVKQPAGVKKASSNGVSSPRVAALSEDERKDFTDSDTADFANWVIENEPSLWRKYFTEERRFSVMLEKKDREIAELKKQLEAAKEEGQK